MYTLCSSLRLGLIAPKSGWNSTRSQMLGIGVAHKVDIHVGQKLRQRRWLIGMTQQKLAEMVGIKFQQIQKYETGANRVSASRLWDISEALGVPAAHFFEGAEDLDARMEARVEGDTSKAPADLLNDKEAMDLVRSYYAIPEHQRRRLFELARVLSDVA
ncbi:MAG: transcriptional regulator with XRE-family HTH domain [Ascidiaceihabitans sp.]|jgi:transcriptional regulator with XRE-family HTH domain